MFTIQDYVTRVRILLQDTVDGAYRYEDSQLILGLELAFMEAKRLRADLFVHTPIPKLIGEPMDTVVGPDEQYQSAFMYYVAGHVQLSDQEDTTDGRASIFLNKFTAQLMTPAA